VHVDFEEEEVVEWVDFEEEEVVDQVDFEEEEAVVDQVDFVVFVDSVVVFLVVVPRVVVP
jgi:hypothetical protein